jgi:signal transduction histidine kinase
LAQRKSIAPSDADRPVWIKGNPDTVSQAVRNLAENAISHTPEGTTVEIVVRNDGSVCVLDQGPGISEGERELVFRRFWRRDRSRAGGTGLRLPIVQRIVEVHAGTVTVVNCASGGGEQFSLSFVFSALTWPRSAAGVSYGTLCLRRMSRPRFHVWMVF